MTATRTPEYPEGAEKAARSPVEIAPSPPTKPPPAKELTKLYKEAKDKIEAFVKSTDPKDSTLLLIAGTGTGKTFAGSQIALEALPEGAKMIVAENLKRVTSESARYILEDRKRTHPEEKIKDVVGFQNKNEREVGKNTRLLFCPIKTVLNKAARGNGLLEDYDLIMIDEVHKESTDNGVLLETLYDIQQKRAKTGHPLKIILTSATMDEVKLGSFFEGAQKIEVPGANIDVPINYLTNPVPIEKIPEAAAQKVTESLKDDDGNILVFLSGQKQIENTEKEVIAQLGKDADKYAVVKYIGSMTPEEQDAVVAKFEGKRLIILATNAAQEGLTWKIKVVVDGGTHKHLEFDDLTGKSYLVEKPAPRDHMIQRKGRIGRKTTDPHEKPDKYYALLTKEDWDRRPEHETADIVRTDLTDVVLAMLARGDNPYTHRYINKPPERNINLAYKRLEKLGAIKGQALTEKGRFMAQLEVSANNASLVADGVKYGVPDDSAALAAMLEEYPEALSKDNDILKKIKEGKQSDLLPFIDLFREYKSASNKSVWAEERGLRADKMKDVLGLYTLLLNDGQNYHPEPPVDTQSFAACGLDLAIHDSFADVAIDGSKKSSLRVHGVGGVEAVRIDKRSALFNERVLPSFISANVRTREAAYGNERVASLNHPLSKEAQGILYGLEHPTIAESSKPKAEEDRSQKAEDRMKEATKAEAEVPQPIEEKPDEEKPPEKLLKWYQKVSNWFRNLWGGVRNWWNS
jgi:HrpA-like RNA helicase